MNVSDETPQALGADKWRIAKFLLVGGSGVAVNLGVASVASIGLLHAGTPEGTAKTVSMVLGILVSTFTNFLVNDHWTWGDREKAAGLSGLARRCSIYYANTFIGNLIQLGIAQVALRLITIPAAIFGVPGATIETALASLVGIVIATPVNYKLNDYWTFRDRTE